MPWRHQFWMTASEALAPGQLKALRIGRCLDHKRRHRADQRCLGYPAFALPTQIARPLAAAGGMADMDDTFQVEMRRQSRQVVGINGRSGTPARVRGAIRMDWQVKWGGQEKALATFAPRIP
jgi:hypothetical protein